MHEDALGGAGYVIYVIEGGRSRVIACRSVALPHCSDNIQGREAPTASPKSLPISGAENEPSGHGEVLLL